MMHLVRASWLPVSLVIIHLAAPLILADESSGERAVAKIILSLPDTGIGPAHPLTQEVSSEPLKALELRVLPAPLTPGPCKYTSLPEFFWDENRELVGRFEQAKREFKEAPEGEYRKLTLVAGAAGVGKSFLTGQVFEKDYPPAAVFKFDLRKLYDQWAEEGICEARPDLAAGDYEFNRLLAMRDHQTPHVKNYLESKDASFIVVDSLSEIHPDDYLPVLRQLQQCVVSRDRPFVHVVVFGRGLAFREFWQRHRETAEANGVALYLLNAPKLQTVGDLAVSSWNYHTWKYDLGWAPDGRTRQEMPLDVYREWVASDFAHDGKFQSVSSAANSSTRADVQRALVNWTSNHRILAATIRNLAGNSLTREIVQREVLAGREYDERRFMRAYLDGWLKRGTKSHGRPSADKPAQLDLYLYALEQIAARYLHAKRVDHEGFFQVGANDRIAVEAGGSRISMAVKDVLDRSGLKFVDPRETKDGRYRFEPVWIHRVLVELHNERCRKAS